MAEGGCTPRRGAGALPSGFSLGLGGSGLPSCLPGLFLRGLGTSLLLLGGREGRESTASQAPGLRAPGPLCLLGHPQQRAGWGPGSCSLKPPSMTGEHETRGEKTPAPTAWPGVQLPHRRRQSLGMLSPEGRTWQCELPASSPTSRLVTSERSRLSRSDLQPLCIPKLRQCKPAWRIYSC